MEKFVRYTLFLLVLVCCQTRLVKSQALAQAQHYGAAEGVPQSYVSTIFQDKTGIVWIGTGKGLAYYGGKKFIEIDPFNADSMDMGNAMVELVFPAPRGGFFIRFQKFGWQHFDPLRQILSPITLANGQPVDVPLPSIFLFEDSKGRLWAKNEGNQCTVWAPGATQPIIFNEKTRPAFDVIYCITESPDKQAVVLVTNSGIMEYTSGTGLVKTNETPIERRDFFYRTNFAHQWLDSSRLIIAVKGKLICYDFKKKTLEDYILLPTANGNDIAQHLQLGKQGSLFIECNRHIYQANQQRELSLVWQSAAPEEVEKEFRAMMIDRNGLLWLGSNANGLYTVSSKKPPFEFTPLQSGYFSDMLPGINQQLSAAYVQPGNKWQATLQYRWHYLNDSSLLLAFGKHELSKNIIGLIQNGHWQQLPGTISDSGVTAGITHIGDTMLAINSYGKLFTWLTPGNRLLATNWPYNAQGRLRLSNIVGLAAANHKVLVVMETSGLVRIDSYGRELPYSKAVEQKMASGLYDISMINGFCEVPGHPGRIYLATANNGILEWDIEEGFIRQVNVGEGRQRRIVYALMPDKQGRIWMATNNGLMVMSNDLNTQFNLSQATGWPAFEFNRYECFKYPNGDLSFGGFDGIVRIQPDQYVSENIPVSVAFTQMAVNGKPLFQQHNAQSFLPLNTGNALPLDKNTHLISVAFTGTNYQSADELEYRYALNDTAGNWTETGNESTINFAGLPSGKHQLFVQCKLPGTQWKDAPVSRLAFSIATPWYATWWAWLLYSAAALGLMIWYFRTKQQKLQLSMALQQEQMHAQQLAEFNAVRTRFFDNITHDLRTPLTLILTPASSLVSHKELGEQPRQYASIIQRQAGRLLHLVNEMLDLAKIQAGEMKISNAVIYPAELSTELLDAFLPGATEKGIKLVMRPAPEMPLVKTDVEKLRRIAENLLSNAIKFTPEGGEVSMHLALDKEINGGAMLQMDVRDNGPGIPAGELDQVFNRFYQRNEQQQGTGIGLSLVKELTGLLRGTVSLTSEPGAGTCFTVHIPVEMLQEEAKAVPEPNASGISILGSETREADSRYTILLAEDHPELRDFLSQQLAQHYRVLVATGGHEAWRLVQEEMPDLVLSDWMMEQGDGLELCHNIKTHDATRHISVILLTAKAATESRIKGLEAGADDYLPKPFVWEELELRLANQLRQQQQLRDYLRRQWLQEVPSQQIVRPEDEFVQRLHQFMETQYASDVDVEKMARHASMSRRTLHRKLTSLLGMSPVEYIQHFRLQKSLALLKAGRTVSEVAYSVGFDSPAYFSKCFKEAFGHTPTSFSAS